jgi:putative ABC transport system permease protein
MELILPAFNSWAGKDLSFDVFTNIQILAGLLGVVILTGLIAGSYPALLLSSFKPVGILKGNPEGAGSGVNIRRALVVAQFALSIFLISSSVIIYKQLDYIRDKNLGFEKDHLIYVQLLGGFGENYESIKSDLQRYPAIVDVTGGLPPTEMFDPAVNIRWEDQPEIADDEEMVWYSLTTDNNYIEAMGMELIDGKSLLNQSANRTETGFIINETAVKMMGYDSPVGRRFSFGSYKGDVVPTEYSGTIIGVVKDFHYSSLHRAIEPVIIHHDPEFLGYMNIRARPRAVPDVVHLLEQKWAEYSSDSRFEYKFVDETIDSFYRAEQKMRAIFIQAVVLAMIIASLGLLGLFSYSTEQRTREIGIRKVLGASISGILSLLIREVLILIVIASLLVWPIAYYVMDSWLQNFAYRINAEWTVFALSALAGLAASVLTVIYQALRAALANPVDALRYE